MRVDAVYRDAEDVTWTELNEHGGTEVAPIEKSKVNLNTSVISGLSK